MVFDIQQLNVHGWTVVAIVGDLDLATAPSFRRAISTAALSAAGQDAARPTTSDEGSGGGLAVDLSAVDFVDSVGVGIILGGLRRQLEAGRPFAVIAPSGPPRSLFERLRLSEIVTVIDSRDDLVASDDE